MGMFPFFPEASDMDLPQLFFMLCVYGYVLLNASQMIGDGSEILLLLFGPGIIGGLILPIMGAIPDCMVILLSGLQGGTREEIQEQLSVGVGTLVGSTALLLTLPWGIAVFLGRRDYDPVTQRAASTASNKGKYTKFSWTNTCVSTFDDIPGTAKIMMIASLSYGIIQIPAFFYKNSAEEEKVDEERPFALTCLLVTLFGFIYYCFLQYRSAANSEIIRRQMEAKRREKWRSGLDKSLTHDNYQEMVFHQHDKDKSGFIDGQELSAALSTLGLKVGRRDVQSILKSIDVGDAQGVGANDGKISLHEFKTAVNHWVGAGQSAEELEKHISHRRRNSVSAPAEASPLNRSVQKDYGSQASEPLTSHSPVSVHGDDGEDEEEEEEEEFWHLTDSQLKMKAFGMLAIGTAICTVFSDPLVDTISQLGVQMGISPFYISFVVTPLASNASEIIASLMFARRRTTETISLTLATLHGAATMNSTLALCVFMCLVYFQRLSWAYTAECICVFTIILLTGLNGLKQNIFMWQGAAVAALYPFSILLVYVLESVFGLD